MCTMVSFLTYGRLKLEPYSAQTGPVTLASCPAFRGGRARDCRRDGGVTLGNLAHRDTAIPARN